MPIALDATYSLGRNLSGVGVYSREILFGLAAACPHEEFLWCYRSRRFLRAYRERLPGNAVRRLLVGSPPGDLFHALNQRVEARGQRTITTFHDLFVMSGDYSSAEFRARFSQQAREAAQRSDAIIAVSRFTAGQVEDLLKIPAERIRVVGHGVRMAGPGSPAQAPKPASRKTVLFVGAIQRRKNVARLVMAFERLPPDWRLVLAGATDGYGAEAELRAVEQSRRRSWIEIRGYVSSAVLEELYAEASVFAFPSLDEGFGIPVLEAMARGIPVVTSNCSALPEVAGGAALLVDPLNVESIGSALLQAAMDDDLRANLARRGLERAKNFSWESAVNQTRQVYDEVR